MGSPTVIVIEDSFADVLALQHYLDLSGEAYQVEALADSSGVLRSIEEYRAGLRGPEPCVILVDLDLPRADGVQLVQAIKKEPALENIHLIALASMVDQEQCAKAERLGAVCREKPETLGQIQGLAAEILQICRAVHH